MRLHGGLRCPRVSNYSMMACFRPEKVIDMNNGLGSHRATPVGHTALKARCAISVVDESLVD
jgi:hypothetical protein